MKKQLPDLELVEIKEDGSAKTFVYKDKQIKLPIITGRPDLSTIDEDQLDF